MQGWRVVGLTLFVGLVLVMTTAVSCRGESKPASVTVSLKEWVIEPASTELKPGRMTFVATNGGTKQHEVVILKTDLPPTQLPIAEGRVDESKLHVVGRVPVTLAGASRETTVSLSPGKYLLICNVVEPTTPTLSHFDQGMSAAVVVR